MLGLIFHPCPRFRVFRASVAMPRGLLAGEILRANGARFRVREAVEVVEAALQAVVRLAPRRRNAE